MPPLNREPPGLFFIPLNRCHRPPPTAPMPNAPPMSSNILQPEHPSIRCLAQVSTTCGSAPSPCSSELCAHTAGRPALGAHLSGQGSCEEKHAADRVSQEGKQGHGGGPGPLRSTHAHPSVVH